MREILPGVWHWTTPNPKLGGQLVSSYWLADGVLIDPLAPPDVGLQWFDAQPRAPRAVVLSNRHHYRDSGAIQARFGCPVYVPAAGLHEFTDGEPVTAYEAGEPLPGGLVAHHVGALSPDEGALWLEAAQALWLADTVVRAPDDAAAQIGWVADFLMDAPEQTKQGLLAALARLLDELSFKHLLLAHGLPLVGDGRGELVRLVETGGRTAPGAF